MRHIANLRVWLDSLDGPRVAAALVFAFVALCIVCAAYDAAHRQRARVRSPRREPLGVRHDRLDQQAARATQPVTSARKAPRMAVH